MESAQNQNDNWDNVNLNRGIPVDMPVSPAVHEKMVNIVNKRMSEQFRQSWRSVVNDDVANFQDILDRSNLDVEMERVRRAKNAGEYADNMVERLSDKIKVPNNHPSEALFFSALSEAKEDLRNAIKR